jgi:hypothetical protein
LSALVIAPVAVVSVASAGRPVNIAVGVAMTNLIISMMAIREALRHTG